MNLNSISKHRTALMGIATLMIIVCHAPASGVVLPKVLSKILELGNFGVDIFLFLSGCGCYYSLSKTNSWSNFLKKRYVRIGVPYLLITLPYIFTFLLLGVFSLRDAILSLTTFDYWVEHKGAWFVALIIPLYLCAPVIFRILSGKRMLLGLVIMTVSIMWICSTNADSFCDGIINNIQPALKRTPSFLIGMAIGKFCKEDYDTKDIRLRFCIIGGGVLYIACYLFLKQIFVGWLVIPLLILMLVKLLEFFPSFVSMLIPLGTVSLESYLTNIYINHFFRTLIPSRINHGIFHGRYLEYIIVIVLGLAIAFWINRKSTKIIKTVMQA